LKENILLVHLGALGAVVRSTALLPALKRKHPYSRLVWVTQSPAHELLKGNPLIDEVICRPDVSLHPLTALRYSHAYCVDKSLQAFRVAQEFRCDRLLGFRADSLSGAILPANPEAKELWELGLSNEKKFFENKKTENQLVHEALCLGKYERDEYQLPLSELERHISLKRRQEWTEREAKKILLGVNVGCSQVIPAKKLSVKAQRALIKAVQRRWKGRIQVVLLGGREDVSLAQEIGEGLDVIFSPMNQGLRDGMISLSACDFVLTGDSLGLHLGVAFKKWVIAWFGPTCAHEIDLYERGVKVLAQVSCSPCWKRFCDHQVMCYDQVALEDLLEGIEKGVQWKSSLSRPPFREICT